MKRLQRSLQIAAAPIPKDTRDRLRTTWEALPAALRTGPRRQFQGRQYVGCGATIGAMPRCDFACRGCYLSHGANRARPQPLDEVKRQLDRLRRWLGEGGNVQLTDGELTLLPRDVLLALVRYAREIGLVPMLMTHGDHLLRDPDLLETLMREGGLREVALHVDTTQRGRRDRAYRGVSHERDLAPLRVAFAKRVRRARRVTRLPLDVALTVTVTSANLEGVGDVVGWLLAHADAFKMVSFQPLAPVGRTERGLEGVAHEALWSEIARGLGETGPSARTLAQLQGCLGHPDCSRFVQGWVVREDSRAPRFAALIDESDPRDAHVLDRTLDRFGGLTFRGDDRVEAALRAASLATRHPGFLLRHVGPAVWRQLIRLSDGHPLRFLAAWLMGRARIDYLNLVSHHFMSGEEIRTPRGRVRLAACAFRVAIDGELVSMCEVNALGRRAALYEALATRGSADADAPPPPTPEAGGSRRLATAPRVTAAGRP